jgi:hypothetical protein
MFWVAELAENVGELKDSAITNPNRKSINENKDIFAASADLSRFLPSGKYSPWSPEVLLGKAPIQTPS